jgi:hypothetical protein
MGGGEVWAAAKKHYGRSCVDDSCASGYNLDDISNMSDGDTAVVPADPTYEGPLHYLYDEDSGVAESLPDVVDPDAAGAGRWILQKLPVQGGGTSAATAAAARAALGLTYGSDVQAFHAYLADIAGITAAKGDIIYFDGSDWVKLAIGSDGKLLEVATDVPSWTDSVKFSQLTTPTDESADAALTALGQVHIRGDEDRFSAHAGAGGEIAGEVTRSFLNPVEVCFDPAYMYDQESTGRNVPLMEVFTKVYPNGIIIDYMEVEYNKDPTTELTSFDINYADAWIGLANTVNIVSNAATTAGVWSEDTDSNFNSGTAIPAGKFIFLHFDADPTDANVVLCVRTIFHAEED